MNKLSFTNKQLEAMGRVAVEEFSSGSIDVEPTNLHTGTTIVMRGTSNARPRKPVEILVSESGQTADLSKLNGVVLSPPRPMTAAEREEHVAASRGA